MITLDQLKDIKERTDALNRYLAIEDKLIQVEEEQLRTQVPGFWDDAKKAEAQMKKVKELQSWIDGYKQVKSLSDEVEVAFEFCKDELITETELDTAYATALEAIETLELKNMLRQEADQMDCVLKINSGAGGTEAQDWCDMLSKTYIAWAEKNDYICNILSYTEGEVTGYKSITLQIIGNNVYGFLKNEQGVHRLVRVSPFDAANRRHTSFVAVEVIPEIDNTIEITIKPEDLRIDTFRSSGKGGQHVNTTDSAVRITHLPTNTVAACQSERSQLQNKETAMKMLMSKLTAMAEQQHLDSIDKLKGEKNEIAWGNQIRSYVFHPYSMIKDHRSSYETSNVQKYMSGYINECLFNQSFIIFLIFYKKYIIIYM